MSTTMTERSLADVVTSVPGAARVFERHGLDYCCGGKQRLDAACRRSGIDPEEIANELADLGAVPAPVWAQMGPAELVDHLEQTHHAYLHAEFPRLSALAAKVAEVHGARHPELIDVQAAYEAVRSDLDPHLMREERVLFPMIRELATSSTRPQFHCGTLANPISVMLAEHDSTGDLLARLRNLTDGYQTPSDGCASYRAFYDGLAELEADTHLHIHKENNVLFPAVTTLEAALPSHPA
jgi:regulator of cell morphogenesis and NO signaling